MTPIDHLSRRSMLNGIWKASVALGLCGASEGLNAATTKRDQGFWADAMEGISPTDDQFLEEIEKANFLFFLEQTDAESGLVKDRCNVRQTDTSVVASIAATGFGLTALCIGQSRGYISLPDAHKRVIT